MKNDFKKARFNLVLLYLLIIGSVIGIFSSLIIYQAKDSFSDPVVSTEEDITINAHDAITIAQTLRPGQVIEETEYEIEDGILYFTTTFEDESETKVNLLTGEVVVPKEPGGLLELMTDDFEEKVGWIALFIFMLSALLCMYVANRTLNPIMQNMRAQKQFISGAAHELRNPLAALHARIESLLRFPSGELKEEVLHELLGETKQLIQVSESLLALERGEAKKVNIQPLSVQQIIYEVKSHLGYMIQEKKIHIQEEIDTTFLSIDRDDLYAILYNLLHNAIKFSKNNGSIHVTWSKPVLSVSDKGIGIEKGDLIHIFDRFYKGDSSRGSIGSGLGLSIVKEIADRYGAHIKTTSVVGEGTTVRITF